MNACGVFLMGINLGLKPDEIKNRFEYFTGVKYRLDYQGYLINNNIINNKIKFYNKTKFYYDYAVHPTEVESTLSSFNSKKILIIWHPHKNERLKHTFDQWINVFNSYDLIVTELMQPKPIQPTEVKYLEELYIKLNCTSKEFSLLSDLSTCILNKINNNYYNNYYNIVISFGLRFDIFDGFCLE